MAKHLKKTNNTLDFLIADIIRIKRDMITAQELVNESIKTRSDFDLAMNMREECWQERRDCLDLINQVAGSKKRDYAAQVLCPI